MSSVKQAILDYGPVSVAMCATAQFQAYVGGVFNACPPDPCGMSSDVNHIVMLVGWDDSQGTDGVWILRNSWGSSWGEGGYARIEYGCLNVEYAACYADYPGNHFTIWADFAYGGFENGTFSKPYDTLAEAIGAVAPGGAIWIKTGASPETFAGSNAIDKATTLHAYDGPVIIGQ